MFWTSVLYSMFGLIGGWGLGLEVKFTCVR